MSTIVIVKKDSEAAIAADTLTTCSGMKISAALRVHKEKILRFQETCIGFVGYAAHKIRIAWTARLRHTRARMGAVLQRR